MYPNGTPPPPQLSSPSAGDICKPSEVVGHLLLVRPVEFSPDFPTSNGARDAIRVDVCDLSANDQNGQWGAVYRDALWFSRGIVPGLRRQIGEIVLGRMTQGVAKPGQNPPFNLVDMMPDAQAVAAAQAWLAQHPEFVSGHMVSSPAAATPPPPVVQPPPQPVPVPQYTQPQMPYPPQQPQPQYGYGPVQPAAVPPSPAPYVSTPQYGPVPPVGAGVSANNPSTTAPAGPQVQPGVDPFAMLTEEQRRALAAIGFPPPG